MRGLLRRLSAPWGGGSWPQAVPGTLKELSQYLLKKRIPKTLSMLAITAMVNSSLILIIPYATPSPGLTWSPSPCLVRVPVRSEAAMVPAECWVLILSCSGQPPGKAASSLGQECPLTGRKWVPCLCLRFLEKKGDINSAGSHSFSHFLGFHLP